MPLLELLDRLGCKSNGRTHFLLGKNTARSLYRIHVSVQRRRGYGGVVVAQQVCPTALSWLGFVILSVDPIRIEIFSSSFHSDFFTQKLELLARSANRYHC